MKATGIVRRVDDLGRIVIPKEIRRTLRIREGDPSPTSFIHILNLSWVLRRFVVKLLKNKYEIEYFWLQS